MDLANINFINLLVENAAKDKLVYSQASRK
jgi:hypothetical protein